VFTLEYQLYYIFRVVPISSRVHFYSMTKRPNRIQIPARLHPGTRDLLERASQDTGDSMSAIIDRCVRETLQSKYGQLEPRLQRFLSGIKQ
jgi:hypothetical protein